MTNIAISDEEFEEARKVQADIKELLAGYRHTLNNLDSYTKEEVARDFAEFLDIFELANDTGWAILEGSNEIEKMINPT
jgi:hypothetical protein